VQVTVVDRRHHRLFQPLLDRVATAALSPGDIAYPTRSILKEQSNADATAIDQHGARLITGGVGPRRDRIAVISRRTA
jgi:NADH dehydrogenase